MTLTNSMSQSLENARLFNETERLLKMMEGELKIARRTQRSILPLRIPRRRGYDFGTLIMPARAVGGDFYDFIHLGRDRLGLVIGDVSDKGLPAALVMALTFSLLRTLSERTDDPYATLLGVNRYLLKMNASGMFVTLLYGILNYRTGRLKYARAGHLPPIILGAEGEAVEVEVDTGQPLGIFEDVELDVQETLVPPGGLALLFSDGLNEAADDAGREFGFERIRSSLSEHRGESARGICRKLWEEVNIHTGDQSPQDDFVTVVIRRT
jgi:sigma-B regulation protein RsbU (phosphoserine phosphatase)